MLVCLDRGDWLKENEWNLAVGLLLVTRVVSVVGSNARPHFSSLLASRDSCASRVLCLPTDHDLYLGVGLKVEEPSWVVVVTSARCDYQVGVTDLERRGQHAGAGLPGLAADCRELEYWHTGGVPPGLAKGYRENGAMHHVHSLEGEVARHAVHTRAFRCRPAAQDACHLRLGTILVLPPHASTFVKGEILKLRKLALPLVALSFVLVAACSANGNAASEKPTSTSMQHSDKSGGMTAAEMADMGHTSSAGDRGFSKLGNGKREHRSMTLAVSKADRRILARQMVLARETALKYPTVADAEAGGLRRAGPFTPGLGAHYLNLGNVGGAPDGVMTDEWIARPLAWIYDGTHPDSRIAGLFYSSSVKIPKGFAGPNDMWHAHKNVCLVYGPDGIDTPLGADRGATSEECNKIGGQLIRATQKLVHVWVVPGYESPEGVFSHLSSAITCDDGSYRTIKDVTKVGKRTTLCVDGTE